MAEVNGCRYCGALQRDHGRRYDGLHPRGITQYNPPSDRMRLHRLEERCQWPAGPCDSLFMHCGCFFFGSAYGGEEPAEIDSGACPIHHPDLLPPPPPGAQGDPF